MARKPKPWWWDARGAYYVNIKGVKHRLDPDQEIAEQMFHALMAKPDRPAKPLLDDAAIVIIDKFFDWCKQKKPDSFDWYFRFLNPFCKVVAGLRVHEVKPHHVEGYLDDHPTWGQAARRAAVTAIKRAFNWAVKQGYIDSSPVKLVEKPESVARERVVSRKEHNALLKQVNPQFADLLELAWETGARPFELYLLETRHLDLKNKRAIFPKNEAKGKKKPRVIYFSSKALQIIKRSMGKSGPVLRNVDGNAWNVHSINSTFARLARKKNAQPRYCLYNWRHSFAHRKLSEGVDSMVVATLMSHSDTQMLSRVYGHLQQNQEFLLKQLNK